MSAPDRHPLVDQLRFARSEFQRGLVGVSEEDAQTRLRPMNSIGWMVGHMAWHEQLVWLRRGQGLTPRRDLDTLVGNGRPASTPPLADMWAAWSEVTALADPFLDSLTIEALVMPLPHDRRTEPPSTGTQLQRVIYHYWVHAGESTAVRQILGHRNVPEFVGNIDAAAPYRPEPRAPSRSS